jgi:hypothetical protein
MKTEFAHRALGQTHDEYNQAVDFARSLNVRIAAGEKVRLNLSGINPIVTRVAIHALSGNLMVTLPPDSWRTVYWYWEIAPHEMATAFSVGGINLKPEQP